MILSTFALLLVEYIGRLILPYFTHWNFLKFSKVIHFCPFLQTPYNQERRADIRRGFDEARAQVGVFLIGDFIGQFLSG